MTLDPNSVRGWQGIQFTTANQLLNNWTDDRAATLRRADDAVTHLERFDPEGSATYNAKTFKLRQRAQRQPTAGVGDATRPAGRPAKFRFRMSENLTPGPGSSA